MTLPMNLAAGEADLLLVEDNHADVALVLRALGKSGPLRVSVVMDGEEAIEFLFCRGRYAIRDLFVPPGLILLDLKLPRLDGFQLLRIIKRDPRTRRIPVVAFSSSGEQRDIDECYSLGANSYVRKPQDLNGLDSVIGQIRTYWFGANEAPSLDSVAGSWVDEKAGKVLP